MTLARRAPSPRPTMLHVPKPQPWAGAFDRARLVTVTLAAVLCVAGALAGAGIFGGGGVREAGNGALRPDATRLAPAGPAFAIWMPIYLGLAGYALWQWLPAQRNRVLHRRIGWFMAAAMAFNAGWILVVLSGALDLSMLMIAGLLASLTAAFRHSATPSDSGAGAVLCRGTIGIKLGWVTVVAGSNAMVMIARWDFNGFGLSGDIWAVALLAAAAGFGAWLSLQPHGGFAAAGLAWALAWIAVARLAGSFISVPTAVAATTAAVVVVTLGLYSAYVRRMPGLQPARAWNAT